MNRRDVVTPLGALARGLVAGVAGTLIMDRYFKYTARWTPSPPEGVFSPPEELQKQETSVVTVARRLAEDLMQRGPLSEDAKRRGGRAVHLGFGGAWGGLYGLARETFPVLTGPAASAGFGTLVWSVGDNAMLPLLRLSAWPGAYPWKVHAHALGAHLAYGAGVWAAYEATRRPTWEVLATGLMAIRARRRLRQFLPKRARPAAKGIVESLAAAYVSRPVQRARAVVASA